MPSTAVDYDPFKTTEVTSTPVEGNPFATAKVESSPVEKDPFKEPTMGAAYGKAVAESVVPTAGGLAGAAVTLAAGAPLIAGATTVGSPIAGAGVAIGLGLAGAIPGSYAASKIQDLVKNLVPNNILQEYGLDPQTRAAEIKAFPIASQLGELTPSLAAFRPGRVSSLERVAGTAIGTGVEAGQQLIEGKFDPERLAVAGLWQAAAPKTTRLGEKLFPIPSARTADGSKTREIKPEYNIRREDSFIRKIKAEIAERDLTSPLVETALRNKETGEIERMGPKHDQTRKESLGLTRLSDEKMNQLMEPWKDLPQDQQDIIREFIKASHETSAQEKFSRPEDWTPEEKTAWDKGWEEFSKARGYSKEQIEAFRKYQDLFKKVESIVGEDNAMGIEHELNQLHGNYTHEAGFIDERGNFHTREKAVDQAKRAGQIPEDHVLENPPGEQPGLHSGDLRKAGDKRFEITKDQPASVLKKTVEPKPVIEPDRYNPRKVTSEEDLRTKGRELIVSQGEQAARDFYRAYEEYKQTWINPVKEVETFVGLNINNKMAMERLVTNVSKDIELSAPKETREKIATAIDSGQIDTLTGSERELADKYVALMKDIGQRAKDAGVIKGLIENYVTHIVDWKKQPKGALETFLNDLLGQVEGRKDTGMSPTSRFAEKRRVATFEDVQAALKGSNLELKTTDLAEIYKEYAMSMERAIENKKLIENILTVRNVAGESLVRKITDTEPLPYGWEMLNSPQFPGYAVHPDLMPALKFAFEARGNQFINAAYMASQAVKRINVLGSFFHAKSLMEVLSSTDIPIWTPIKEAVVLPLIEKGIKATTGKDVELSGITKAVEAFRNGGVGDSVDNWIKTGLVLEIPQDATMGALSTIGKAVDSVISKFGPQTRILESSLSSVEKYTLGLFDKFTWDYLHTGGKLYIADKYLERARIDAEKAGKDFDEAASRQEIARFINKSFGGLNWFDLARESSTKFGKQMAMAAYSPQGRKGMQLLLFAPDWTISTIKAFTAALPSGLNPSKWHPVAGAKNLRNPTTQADYARLYQLKTALTYLTLLNGFNIATANRPIWENKDPTRIEYPDGTSMQAMKHAMEPYHWISAPTQTLTNKLGFLPKAAIIGITGLEYPSPYAPKMADPSAINRLAAIGSQALPFQISAAKGAPEGEGIKRAVYGTLGFPLYGTTPEERRRANAERNRIIREKRKEYKQRAREKGWE